jgi:hypothetical protein
VEESKEQEKDDQEVDSNKTGFIYPINKSNNTNPFFITREFSGKLQNCLIYTSADVSIIHWQIIPDNINRSKYVGTLRAAFGTNMNLRGKLKNESITIRGYKYTFSPLISE